VEEINEKKKFFWDECPVADEISYLAQFLVLSIFTHLETKENLNER